MKYLNYRKQFLNDNNQLLKDINSSKMINEVLENDLEWGDSLLGRLINSTIRVLKVGYGVSRVPNLLKEFEASLSELITDSMTEDLSEKFNLLALKNLFEELKDVCLSTQTDPQKLGILIGWNGRTEMYDPQDPTADIPGQYEGRSRRILATPSLVQRIIDVITNDLPNMEKFIGEGRNELLDRLSDFGDELRKLTLPVGVNPGGGGAARQPFSLRLSRVLNSLTNVNASFKFASYYDFINEEAGETKFAAMSDDQFEDYLKTVPAPEAKENARKLRAKGMALSLKGLKQIAIELLPKIKEQEDEDIKKMELYDKLLKSFSGLSKEDREKIKALSVEGEDGKKVDLLTALENIKKEEPFIPPPPKQIGGDTPGASASQTKEGGTDKASGASASQTKEGGTDKASGASASQPKGQPTTYNQNFSNSGNFKYVVTKDNQSKSSNIYSSYINLILEEQNPPPAPAPPPGGGPTKPSVQDTWTSAWEQFDGQLQGSRISQREADELEELIQSGADQLTIDFTMRPDPLIRIVRIFKKAHNLYYTPIIPSGRKKPNIGSVSSKTYREYSYVGTGTPGMPDNPGYGPWINNLIFEKWSDGVMKILQDQQYRKILANMNFIVPGSADMFNKESTAARESIKITSKIYQMILEAETRTTGESSEDAKKKKSQGQILFDFINDMLDKQIQGDFDGARKKILKKYFGVEVGEDKLKITENTPAPAVNQRDVDANSYIYKAFTDDKFKDTDCGQFFAFPIEDQRASTQNNPHEMIFIQPIKIDGNKVEVKFTFDRQTCINQYMQDENSSASKIDWSEKSGLSTFVYYGVMLNNNLTQGLKICYVSINNSSQTPWPATGININIFAKPSSAGQSLFKIKNGNKRLVSGNVAVSSSRLVYYDNTKQEKVAKGDFNKQIILREKFSDEIRRDLDLSGVKLYNALLAEGIKPDYGFWT
jgi:hypothetical protein